MPEFPNYFQLEEIERDFDRRGDTEGKKKYREKLYAELRHQYLTSPSLETADNLHVRRHLEDELLEEHWIGERSDYTPRQSEYICAAAQAMKSGEDRDGATAFYRRVGRRLKPPVRFARVAQVFGAKGNGGLGWRRKGGSWDEFRAKVLLAASRIGCDRS